MTAGGPPPQAEAIKADLVHCCESPRRFLNGVRVWARPVTINMVPAVLGYSVRCVYPQRIHHSLSCHRSGQFTRENGDYQQHSLALVLEHNAISSVTFPFSKPWPLKCCIYTLLFVQAMFVQATHLCCCSLGTKENVLRAKSQ